jgi:xylan 1,4-beta-xylosidase
VINRTWKPNRALLPLSLLLLSTLSSVAQQSVTIKVDLSKSTGRFEPVWAWVGHDEPNYTYTGAGRDLLTKLTNLSPYPVYDRTHNLLTSGDGTPALKWGSTNAFTRDAVGKPVYNWTIIDKVFDTYKATGITPFVEIGFMPEALSTHPEPYQHHWPTDFATGWSYPPKDYQEWSDLIYHWVRHMVDRYGDTEVAKWQWEVWNEPDIFYWHGTIDDYLKFYDYTVSAVRRALPGAKVGGPASTSPSSQRAGDFLQKFLEHCANGPNFATGKKGVPLDFISFHAKGKASLIDGHVELNIGTSLRDIDRGFAIVQGFPALQKLPVVISESDPETCAACDVASHPQNAFRLSSQYASHQAELLSGTIALAAQHHINLQGSVTWAFTFPGEPIFAGYRSFTTHGIDLPLLNAFRMFGQMKGDRVAATSTGALLLNDVVQSSVRAQSDVNAIATRDSHRANVLIWNYHDDSNDSSPAEIHLIIEGISKDTSQMLLEHWRVDHDHSNAYFAWEAIGSPQNPTEAQVQFLKAAGQLQLLESPRWIEVNKSSIELSFTEPRQGVSLLSLSW